MTKISRRMFGGIAAGGALAAPSMAKQIECAAKQGVGLMGAGSAITNGPYPVSNSEDPTWYPKMRLENLKREREHREKHFSRRSPALEVEAHRLDSLRSVSSTNRARLLKDHEYRMDKLAAERRWQDEVDDVLREYPIAASLAKTILGL